MKKRKILLLPLILFALSACHSRPVSPSSETETFESESSSETEQPTEAGTSEETSETESESETSDSSSSGSSGYDTPVGFEDDPINVDPVAQDYYKNISKTATGSELANQLKTLVNKNRCTTGYGSLWSYYPYCDADPDNPKSGKIIAFYRGTPATQGEMNKEHVWPNSRGGNLVEGDPHMTRPTLTKDNSSRGNSFYVENMCSTTDGWDPKMDGLNESFRGDSARIIFYAAIAKYGTLKLVDKNNDSTGNQSMGKLSDLIKWNFEYPISKYERFRNEVLSGERSVNGSDYDFNRNPFIDDRTLPCRIWGDTNSETQRLCQMYLNKKAPTEINLNETSINIAAMEEFQLKVESVSPAGAYDAVTWSSNDDSVATVDSNGLVRGVNDGETYIIATSVADTSIVASCKVTVETADRPLEDISVTPSLTLAVGSYGEVKVTNNPTNAYPRPTYTFTSGDKSVAEVDQNGLVTGLAAGNVEITVVAKQNDVTKYGYCQVSVTESQGFTKVTSKQSNWAGKYLIVNESNNKAFDSSASTISSSNSIDVTISNGKINVSKELLSALVIVEQVGNEYIMKTSTGKTIKSGKNTIAIDEEGTTRSTFTLSGDSIVINSGGTEYSLQYNQSANLFRYYSSNQQPVTMYRLS